MCIHIIHSIVVNKHDHRLRETSDIILSRSTEIRNHLFDIEQCSERLEAVYKVTIESVNYNMRVS